MNSPRVGYLLWPKRHEPWEKSVSEPSGIRGLALVASSLGSVAEVLAKV